MIRDVLALASDALERQVITMWLNEGYVPATIQGRILDKRRIYRHLGRNEPASALARKLCFEKVGRIAQEEARRRPGDRKLNTRIILASLRAWADALRTLGKPVPAWISEASGDLIDEYWSNTRRVRALAEKTFNDHRLYITWFLEDLKKRKIALHAIALADVDHFVSTLTPERKLAVTSAANACICIRHFLRFLYRTKRLSADLAPAVIGPTLRQMLKRPPERVSWTALKRVLGALLSLARSTRFGSSWPHNRVHVPNESRPPRWIPPNLFSLSVSGAAPDRPARTDWPVFKVKGQEGSIRLNPTLPQVP
jgi:hypothetical protein